MSVTRRALIGRLSAAAVLPGALSGCIGEEVWAPDDEVSRAIYRDEGPPSVTVFTMIRNLSNEGAHSGLMVNGSQRLIFDPAGSFNHPQLPERNDVFFGINERALAFYIDYHARETYRVAVNQVPVSATSAERALGLVQKAGPVGAARCNIAIVEVLRELPEFPDIPGSWFPINTMRYLENRPDVKTSLFTDDSPDNRGDLVRVPLVR
ncbi:MAG: hypothetical protein AAGG09_16960 [Pseudomonadota bacterium]